MRCCTHWVLAFEKLNSTLQFPTFLFHLPCLIVRLLNKSFWWEVGEGRRWLFRFTSAWGIETATSAKSSCSGLFPRHQVEGKGQSLPTWGPRRGWPPLYCLEAPPRIHIWLLSLAALILLWLTSHCTYLLGASTNSRRVQIYAGYRRFRAD